MHPTFPDKKIEEQVNQWLEGPYDNETKEEIRQLLKLEKFDELTDAFYRGLEFGTGGLRGIIGLGPNRMNKYTLGMATQGFSNYLKQSFPGEAVKVAIAYDNREKSDIFAGVAADVFSANGIHVFFFESLRPTPELSFAIRELGCQGGVMITASHNPKEYNGYKAYWHDGGQLIAPHDTNVIAEVNKISDIGQVNFEQNAGLISTIGSEIDKVYLEKISGLSLAKEYVARQKDLKIVFSSIHGTGITMVPPALEKWGFTNINIVEEQATPDPGFPTVIYPNPEEEEAMTLALEKGREIDADLVMATDPDGDRVGVAVKNHEGKFQLLNGNQIGSLLVNYVLGRKQETASLKPIDFVVKTIVTTGLIEDIARAKKVTCYEVLTGFKFIGALITGLEGKQNFLVGGEESYGYLVGDLVRDKDAVVSCAFIAEMTAFYKENGKSLFDALMELYLEHGFYLEKLVSLTREGKKGAEEIKAVMERLRNSPPETLGGSKVVMIKDYQISVTTNRLQGTKEQINLPKSNVLQFFTDDGSAISARPSGTEPKIKFYCSVKAGLDKVSDYDTVKRNLSAKIDKVMEDIVH